MKIILTFLMTGALFVLVNVNTYAKGVYQSNSAFIDEVFNDPTIKPKMLWLTGDVKAGAVKILGEKPRQLRVRYWRKQQKTAWILEAIGKTKPITVGLVIDAGKLQRVKVLAFRETRGWEVKEDFFLDQFSQRTLTPELQLDKSIDGITGATLSVRALKKLARLALFYHQQVLLKAHLNLNKSVEPTANVHSTESTRLSRTF